MEAQISSVICGFLERLGYSKPAITIDLDERSKLKEALLDDFNFFRNHPRPSEWFDKISRVSIDLAQASSCAIITVIHHLTNRTPDALLIPQLRRPAVHREILAVRI